MYYKSTTDAPAKAHAELFANREALFQSVKALEEQFDGKAVYGFDVFRIQFHGLALNNVETRDDSALWTKPDKSYGNTSRIRSSIRGKELSSQLRALKDKYSSLLPDVTRISLDELWSSIGTNAGDLFFAGIKWHELDGVIYVHTRAKLGEDMVEILASEYEQAKQTADEREANHD